ncbi:hypothetical protein P2318_23740 [Myxococcaceae bacterium GXIMD 01537]
MRHLLVPFSALVLAAGCGKTEEPAKAECEPEVVDLASCDRGTLGALQAEGVWNTNLVFNDGESSPSAFRFGASPLLAGLPMTEKRVSGDSFFLISDVENASAQKVRYLFAGCTASGPGQMEGKFRRCTAGAKDLEGTFQAQRVSRRAGEDVASQVELVSETALSTGSASDLVVSGNYAYVMGLQGGLFVYDVSDRLHPALKASIKPSDGDVWNQVAVQGTTAYIASSARGIRVYDLSNLASPTPKAALPSTAVDVSSVYVDGNRLYAASPSPNAEVFAYDITNPTAPTLQLRYFVEDSNPNVGDRPMEVVARGNTMYVSHWTYGLAVVDVTNPKAFKLAGKFKYADATSRAVTVGDINGRLLAFETSEDWGGHLRILDVGVPDSITQAGEYSLRPQVSARAFALSGTKLYAASYQDGLRILDVSNPSEPRPVGYYNSWSEADASSGVAFYEGLSNVKVPGDGYIYATDTKRGLLILKETN